MNYYNSTRITNMLYEFYISNNSKILYIIPSMKFYKKEILPVIDEFLTMVDDAEFSISDNILSIKGHEGYILFRVHDDERLKGSVIDVVYIDEHQIIDRDTYSKLSSLVRIGK